MYKVEDVEITKGMLKPFVAYVVAGTHISPSLPRDLKFMQFLINFLISLN